MASEDFSFPKISNPLPSFAISPSLWRVSSVVYPEYPYEQEHDQKDVMNRHLKVYSRLEFGENNEYQVLIERGSTSITSSDLEKMDMLWEDFNDEELQTICNSDKDKNNQPEKSSSSSSTSNAAGLVSDSIKRVGRVMHIYDYQGNRRSKMVSFVKLLKKIFLLDGTPARIKN